MRLNVLRASRSSLGRVTPVAGGEDDGPVFTTEPPVSHVAALANSYRLKATSAARLMPALIPQGLMGENVLRTGRSANHRVTARDEDDGPDMMVQPVSDLADCSMHRGTSG